LDDDDSDDHAVNTEDTGHDHGNHRLHDQFGFEHSHRADADTCLCGPVGGAQVGEDEGGGDSDISEEELRAVFCGALGHVVCG